MPKYMIQASYSVDGLKGLLSEGGTSREAAARKLIEGVGGTLESLYFTFGGDDVVAICDVPDNVSIAAAAMTIAATGAIQPRTTVLLTPAEIDAAAKKSVDYRPPGG